MTTERLNVIHSQPKQVRIENIVKSNTLGIKGSFDVAIVRDLQANETNPPAWYPLPENHSLNEGQDVMMQHRTEHHSSGGSLTTTLFENTPK